MFDKDSVAAAIADIDIPAEHKEQIGDVIGGIGATVDQHEVPPVPTLIALAFASGVFLSLLPEDRRGPVATALARVQATTMRQSDALNAKLAAQESDILAAAIEEDDATPEVIAARLAQWFKIIDIPPSLAVAAMIRVVAGICCLEPPMRRTEVVADVVHMLRMQCGVAHHQLN